MKLTPRERLERRRLVTLLVLTGVMALMASPTLAQGAAAAAASPAPTPGSKTGEADELQDLLKILNEETAVATKTRMNSDYVPGIVTVLHGAEMAALGARTVWDALSMVPGIEAFRDVSGNPSVAVRGIQFPFNSGNVKILIDSMPTARDNAGINSIVLDFPIELVDRIEVIRGPGSVVYGDFAYMGLIHIVTRRDGAGVFARADEGSSFSGGLFRGGTTKSGLSYSLSAAAFTGGPTEVPDRRNVDDTRGLAFGSLKYRGASLSTGIITRQVTDVSAPRSIPGQQTHSVVEARYETELSKGAHLDLRLNDRVNRYRNTQSDLDGSVLEAGVGLRLANGARHSWLFDLSRTRTYIDEAEFKIPPQTPVPTLPGGQPSQAVPQLPLGFTVRDEALSFTSLMAQDTVQASTRLAITVGARFDKYGDVDTRVTPRASLVYRASERTILKFQYAEGFRAPTFFELYSLGRRNTQLDFEVNQTSELNLVRRGPGRVLRLTAYASNLKKLLYLVAVDAQRHSLFDNSRRARVYGTEVEFERELSRKVKGVVNAALLTSRDSRAFDALFAKRDTAPSVMGDVALITAPSPKVQLAARWHFVGGRSDPSFPAYHELGATLTLKGLVARGLDVRAGARGATGAGVIYPNVLPNQTTPLAYEYPKAFIELSWSR